MDGLMFINCDCFRIMCATNVNYFIGSWYFIVLMVSNSSIYWLTLKFLDRKWPISWVVDVQEVFKNQNQSRNSFTFMTQVARSKYHSNGEEPARGRHWLSWAAAWDTWLLTDAGSFPSGDNVITPVHSMGIIFIINISDI